LLRYRASAVNAEVADVHALRVLQDEGQQQNQDHREERDGYQAPRQRASAAGGRSIRWQPRGTGMTSELSSERGGGCMDCVQVSW
jgi:hypothetical protein